MRTLLPRLHQTITNPTLHKAPLNSLQFRALSSTPFRMSSTPSASELKIEATSINTAPGVDLTPSQKTLVGCVLDLFAGRASLPKLQLWTDDAVFTDPLAIAQGRKQYEAQWYGLQTAFSELERQKHQVQGGGNPIELDLTMRYVVKGVKTEKVINSRVNIHTDAAGEKIVKVEDKWDGKLPDSSIANAFRRLNASTMPHVVGVPKNEEEDAKRGVPQS